MSTRSSLVLLPVLGLLIVTSTAAQVCSTRVPAVETVRNGIPPNHQALTAGRTHGPVLGEVWDPYLNSSFVLPSATVNLAAVTFAPANLSTSFGTLLCDFSIQPLIATALPGSPFAMRVPLDCNLAGLTLCVQGVTADATIARFTNALDINIGTRDTLYREFAAEVDRRLQLAGAPATAKPIYSVQDFGNRVFVRNPGCWAAGLDLTGLSPWNQAGANTRAGTLISPRHIAFATHYQLSSAAGSNEIVFVTDQNVTVTRQVIATRVAAVDITIGLLDADVPPTITHYKVLPRSWSNWLLASNDLPLLHLDQEEKALVCEMDTLGPASSYAWHGVPVDTLRRTFHETLIGGDSGNPAFLVLDGEPILVLTHHYASGGPFYTFHFDAINAAMTQLGGGYQLTEFDLASR